MRSRLLISLAGLIPLMTACATVGVQPLQGQSQDQAKQAHAACFEETHSYWKQTAAAVLLLPLMYLEKNKQNRDYEECMLGRGYRAVYRDGMGYRPDVDIQPVAAPSPPPPPPPPPSPPLPTSPPVTRSLNERITELIELKAVGKITDVEYATMRRKVIESYR